MARMAAFIVLLIPGLMAAAGIKFMRDTLFSNLIFPFPWLWLQFVVGIIYSELKTTFLYVLQGSVNVVKGRQNIHYGIREAEIRNAGR